MNEAKVDPYVCPRCGRRSNEFPAIFRRDEETEICPDCGNLEALEDERLAPPYERIPYWKVQ